MLVELQRPEKCYHTSDRMARTLEAGICACASDDVFNERTKSSCPLRNIRALLPVFLLPVLPSMIIIIAAVLSLRISTPTIIMVLWDI